MVYWQPGTQYNYGDVVTYQGADYKLIQPHRSQSDWTPDIVPALWGKMQGGSGGHGGNGGFGNSDCHSGAPQETYQPPPQHCQPPQQPQQPQQPPQYQQPPPQYSNDSKPEKPQGNDPDSSDDEGKGKKWAIGGGLAAGAALLGAGFAAYKHKEKNDEEDKAGAAAWLAAAEKRTKAFYREGPKAPFTWVLAEGREIPNGAIVVDEQQGCSNVYVGRAYHKGSITVGKVTNAGAVIGFAHDEIPKEKYEILLGDMNALKWVATSGKLDLSCLGSRPVEGGHDKDGTPLYVARAYHKGGFVPGKASEKLKAAFIPYDKDEVEIKKYEILCYN